MSGLAPTCAYTSETQGEMPNGKRRQVLYAIYGAVSRTCKVWKSHQKSNVDAYDYLDRGEV